MPPPPPLQHLRDALAQALAELAAATRHEALVDAAKDEKRPLKKAALEKLPGASVQSCLVAPLVAAALAGRREVGRRGKDGGVHWVGRG